MQADLAQRRDEAFDGDALVVRLVFLAATLPNLCRRFVKRRLGAA